MTLGVGPKPLVAGGTAGALGTAGTAAGGQPLHGAVAGGQHCRLRENHGWPAHQRQLLHPVPARIVAIAKPTSTLRYMPISSVPESQIRPGPSGPANSPRAAGDWAGRPSVLSSLCPFPDPSNEPDSGIAGFPFSRWESLPNVQAAPDSKPTGSAKLRNLLQIARRLQNRTVAAIRDDKRLPSHSAAPDPKSRTYKNARCLQPSRRGRWYGPCK